MAISLPNALTLGRIAAVPLLVAAFDGLSGDTARWVALAIFIAAAVTDWLDGALARALRQESKLGAMLDPIADKLLVVATLVVVIADRTVAGVHVYAAIVILLREVLVSGLREALATAAVAMPVTRLAKWKTAVQMIALAGLLGGPALDGLAAGSLGASLALLWIAALITFVTGAQYAVVALRAMSGRNDPAKGSR